MTVLKKPVTSSVIGGKTSEPKPARPFTHGACLMNIKQLEVLRTLLSTGSTIATAKAMGLSQSGISRLLAQLEADLSLTLFARDKGRLIPTPEAALLARDAENVLLAVDRMSGHAEDLRNGAAGRKSSASACRAACGRISRPPC